MAMGPWPWRRLLISQALVLVIHPAMECRILCGTMVRRKARFTKDASQPQSGAAQRIARSDGVPGLYMVYNQVMMVYI